MRTQIQYSHDDVTGICSTMLEMACNDWNIDWLFTYCVLAI